MQRNLAAVNSSPHIVEKLYVLLVQYAGAEKTPIQVVAALVCAVHCYAAEFPEEMRGVFWRQQQYFLDAMVSQDTDNAALKEAQRLLASMQSGRPTNAPILPH